MGSMDLAEVLEYLRYRYPLLLVDRVLECVPGSTIRAMKNVTINEPFFQGHFPGYPVMPGVLIIEALAQISTILSYKTSGTKPDGKSLIYFPAIDNARFKRPVFPGDLLMLESTMQSIEGLPGKFAVRAHIDGLTVAEAELAAAIRQL